MLKKIPLVSVVIPTFARPKLLGRAVRSALLSAPDGEVEIVIVPNGGGEEWRAVAQEFLTYPEITWHPISQANACVARNHGMSLARGKYIRFLDDDDYLLEAAHDQLLELDIKGVSVSQGGINWVNADGAVIRRQNAQYSEDFFSSVLQPDFFTLLHSFIWLREKRKLHPWDPALKIGDDLKFALSPMVHSDLDVAVFPHPVGVWVHHNGWRLSTEKDDISVSKDLANVLIDIAQSLKIENRLSMERCKVISSRLWDLVHVQFPLAPVHWSQIAFRTLEIAPNSRPNDPEFSSAPLNLLHPVLVEWLFFPHRRFRRCLK